MLYVDRKKSNISLAINKIYWVSIYWQMQLFYLEWEVFWHCYNNNTETSEETCNDTSKIVSVLKFVVSFLKYLEKRIFSSSVIFNVHAIGEKSSQLIFVTRSRKKQFLWCHGIHLNSANSNCEKQLCYYRGCCCCPLPF